MMAEHSHSTHEQTKIIGHRSDEERNLGRLSVMINDGTNKEGERKQNVTTR